MREYVVAKPASTRGYALHRMVMGLTQGAPAIFADAGDRLLIRTDLDLGLEGQAIPDVPAGEMRAFELRACVSKKTRGKHIYPLPGNWQFRHDWLRRQGERHGFEVKTVHCSGELIEVDNGSGRRFSVDSTDFTGVLKVTDASLFRGALASGVGSTSRTFGFGFLII
jgi:hypothetical protein